MRKILALSLLCSAICLLNVSSQAALKRGGGICSYSPLQNVVRTARDDTKIKELIESKVDFNAPQKCGGSIGQLAVLRGNPVVLHTLIEEGALNIKDKVSTVDFPIPGAPRDVPFVLFAAYYAPRADILTTIINFGGDVLQKDDRGEDISWYISKNPVLSDTQLSDDINEKLLLGSVQKKTEEVSEIKEQAPASAPKNAKTKMIEAEPESTFGISALK